MTAPDTIAADILRRAVRIKRAQSLLDSFSGGEGRSLSKVTDVFVDDAPLTVGIVFEDGRTQTFTGAFAQYVLGGVE